MEKEVLQMRQHLVQIAVELYLEAPQLCTVQQVAQHAGIELLEVHKLFRSQKAMLKYFYFLCGLRYQAMIAAIDGFEEFDLKEKFSNFGYVLFDLLNEQRAFVDATFEELILHSPAKTLFQRQVEEIFVAFLASESLLPGLVKASLPALLSRQYLRLIHYWLHDESDEAEETLALVDRVIGFGTEALQSRMWFTGAELLRYLVGRAMPVSNMDIWDFGGRK